jgi:hypothetical protein
LDGSNSEPPSDAGEDAAPRGPERIEAPDRSGQSDLPATAAAQGPGPEIDDEDLPKRRGWWQRWV